jgi:hypothetical protein
MMEPEPIESKVIAPDEPPPLLGTWPRLYTAVLLYLVVLIAGLYTFTRFFS